MAKKDFIRFGKDTGPRAGRSLAKDVLTIVSVGLAAGTALVVGTDKVMTKLKERHEEKREEVKED